MMDDHVKDHTQDWELLQDYYKESEQKELSLEDFITEGDVKPQDHPIVTPEDERLKKTIEEVHKVLTLAAQGASIAEIAEKTALSPQYVYDIQVCAQGFREDDEIAVAHLVLG